MCLRYGKIVSMVVVFMIDIGVAFGGESFSVITDDSDKFIIIHSQNNDNPSVSTYLTCSSSSHENCQIIGSEVTEGDIRSLEKDLATYMDSEMDPGEWSNGAITGAVVGALIGVLLTRDLPLVRNLSTREKTYTLIGTTLGFGAVGGTIDAAIGGDTTVAEYRARIQVEAAEDSILKKVRTAAQINLMNQTDGSIESSVRWYRTPSVEDYESALADIMMEIALRKGQ